MKIAFYTPDLNFRGTCIALYDYALYNEQLLHNHSIIITTNVQHNELAFKRFTNRFQVFTSQSNPIDQILEQEHVDVLYCIKYGTNDGVFSSHVKTAIHCVFDMSEPHGDVYAGVSATLARKYGKELHVPHMISLQPTPGPNLRRELNIPNDAIVFGRHGGKDTFNIDWAKEVISQVVRAHPHIYFVFLNADRWDTHPQIKFLEPTTDIEVKKTFLRTLNAGILPERLGHTFNLALGEMCAYNLPALIYNGTDVWNTAHIEIMGEVGIYFDNPTMLTRLITSFNPSLYTLKDMNAYKRYTPESVMTLFKDVFLT